MRPPGKIIPYARNARKIPPEAVDKVAASIKEFGWRLRPRFLQKKSASNLNWAMVPSHGRRNRQRWRALQANAPLTGEI